jgi:hypothetical protein
VIEVAVDLGVVTGDEDDAVDAVVLELADASVLGGEVAVGHHDRGEVAASGELGRDVVDEGGEHRVEELTAHQPITPRRAGRGSGT